MAFIPANATLQTTKCHSHQPLGSGNQGPRTRRCALSPDADVSFLPSPISKPWTSAAPMRAAGNPSAAHAKIVHDHAEEPAIVNFSCAVLMCIFLCDSLEKLFALHRSNDDFVICIQICFPSVDSSDVCFSDIDFFF